MRDHDFRQCPGPAARHHAGRLPARCGDRPWRLRHHLSCLRQPARQGRGDQGVPADRVRRARGPEGRGARRALRRRFRLGPRALPRRGARARPLPPSAHRAGACASSPPTARPTPSWSSRTAATSAEMLREPGRRLPPDEVRRLAEGLLLGLGAVHAQGFLHRDIKPSNIIIRRDGVPILIDFGAARQAMGNRTRTLTSVLTPQYAPIEQYAADGKQGPWSDIYSAAAVLHHAIAGAVAARSGEPGRQGFLPAARRDAGGAVRPDVPGGDRSRRSPSRPSSGRNRSTNGASCSACRCRAPTMRRRSAWSRARRSGRSDAAPGRRQSRDARTARAAASACRRGRSATPWILLALAAGDRCGRCGATRRRCATAWPPCCRRARKRRRRACAGLRPHLRRRRRRRSRRPPPRPRRRRQHRSSRRRRSSWRSQAQRAGARRARCSTRPRKPSTRRAPWRAKRASPPRAPRDRAWRMPSGSPATTARPMSARWPTASARAWACSSSRTAIARPANGRTMS